MSGPTPIDPNRPLEISLDPYPSEPDAPRVLATLDRDRIVLRLATPGKLHGMRAMRLDDAVSQAAWLVAMSEAGGTQDAVKQFQTELEAARAHIQERFAAKFPKTSAHTQTEEKK